MDRNSDVASGLAGDARSLETNRHPAHLVEIHSFGTNPGGLRGYVHVPVKLSPDAPLVVVLHGCTQNANGFNIASGWSQAADDLGFVLVLPEQRRSNNLGLCFNWFEPADTARDSGEVFSIWQMIETVRSTRKIDRKRIFITGFSGGGGMASAMLATYPEVFAGGAIIAGMPYGTASGTIEAFSRMQGYRLPVTGVLADKIAHASDHSGPWPKISVWHGAADQTVDVANADAIVRQWCAVNGLPEQPGHTDVIDGVPHRVWCGGDGRTAVEDYIIPGMGHGTPLNLSVPEPYGAQAPYMLDVGISSTLRIAQSWGLADAPTNHEISSTLAATRNTDNGVNGRSIGQPEATRPRKGIARLIGSALRKLGLKR